MPKPTPIMDKKRHSIWGRKFIASLSLVAVAVFAFIGFILPSSNLFITTDAYVSIDINPSIELLVNPNQIVIHYEAVNDDAQALLLGTDLLGMTLEEATSTILDLAAEEGYLDVTSTDNAILVHTIHDKASFETKISNQIQAQMEHYFTNNKIFGVVLAGSGLDEVKQEAQALGVSVGKYYLLSTLMSYDDSLDINTLKEESVRDLKAQLDTYDVDAYTTKRSFHELVMSIKATYEVHQENPTAQTVIDLTSDLELLQAKFGISLSLDHLDDAAITQLETYFDFHEIQAVIDSFLQYQNQNRISQKEAYQVYLQGQDLDTVYTSLQTMWTEQYRNQLIESYRSDWSNVQNTWREKFHNNPNPWNSPNGGNDPNGPGPGTDSPGPGGN